MLAFLPDLFAITALLGISLAQSDTSMLDSRTYTDLRYLNDPLLLLQGIPPPCIDNPITNEHICQAWIDAIIANNLQDNMTAIWKVDRPSFFSSEEELTADQAWLDGYALLEMSPEDFSADEQESGDETGLEKRKKKPKTTTTYAAKPVKTSKPKPKTEHCVCCDNERRIICCLGSPLAFTVPCCVKMQKICHKEVSSYVSSPPFS